jgi:hypothetical protein
MGRKDRIGELICIHDQIFRSGIIKASCLDCFLNAISSKSF